MLRSVKEISNYGEKANDSDLHLQGRKTQTIQIF